MMKILEKIKYHKENKQRVRLYRRVSKGKTEISNGYILDYSDKFILIHESDDFKIDGYSIVPVKQVKKLRYDKSDEYFNQMMIWENEIEKVGIDYAIDLSSWQSIFESLQAKELNVVVECEGAEINHFTIGPIVKTGKKHVHILYFDTEGYFEDSPSSIDYKSITRIAFETQYLTVFSKYTRYKIA